MRLLAIDLGARRVGLALSDPGGRIAVARPGLARRDDAALVRDLVAVIAEEGVEGLVIGEPRRLDGTAGDAARRARRFAERLERVTGLPVERVDEALSSREAEARLREAGVDPRRHPERVDALAAQILLEEVLERRKRAAGGPRAPARDHEAGRGASWLLLLLALAALAVGAAWVWRVAQVPYRGFPGAETTVVIEPGSSAATILGQLERAGVIRDARIARYLVRFAWGDPALRAGEYRFAGARPLRAVIAQLERGEVVTYPVTIVEGLTLEETAERLAGEGFGRRERFLAAMRDPAPMRDWDSGATDLEGYLFPSTYSFARGTSERDIVATLVRTFRERFGADVRPLLVPRLGGGSAVRGSGEPAAGANAAANADANAKAEAQANADADADSDAERSVRAIVTLASLVEKEARVDAERPLIAGVYQRRLELGMLLQADPTVIFAKKRRGEWAGNLRRADLAMDDPYNTYRFGGLPPGPIASPGLASLRAAAAPAATRFVFFVSRNDGTHVFAETLGEHNRNVERWQRQYWRDRRAADRAAAAAAGRGAAPSGVP